MWRPHMEPSSSHTPVGKTISLFSSLCIRCCFHKPFLSPDCGVFSHPVIALSRGRGGCFLLESWLFNLNPLLLTPSDCPWILHLKSLGYTARFPLSLHCLSHSAALSTHLETWNAVPAGWYESGCLAQVLGRVQCSIGGGSSKLYLTRHIPGVRFCLFVLPLVKMCPEHLILLIYNFPDTLLPSLNFNQQLSFFLLKIVSDKGQSGHRYLKPYWLSTRGLRSGCLGLHLSTSRVKALYLAPVYRAELPLNPSLLIATTSLH